MREETASTWKARVFLTQAALEALQQTQQALFRAEPDYPTSLAGRLQAVRRAFSEKM